MKSSHKNAVGSVRIIGGQWRGTRLEVPDRPGLRPSSARVRETLFNWLMPGLPGARVLDLFAGTGVLGLECVSRGAASAVLVEKDPGLARQLEATVARLQAQERVRVASVDALRWLSTPTPERFDILLLDPPFAGDLWDAAIEGCQALLAEQAWVYVESPRERQPRVPDGWALHREGQTRDVRYALYRVQAAATLPA